MTNINSIKTLSLASIGIKIKPADIEKKQGQVLAILSGVVHSYFIKNTNFGESKALVGDFIVVNAESGEVFESNTFYLPKDFTDTICNKLDKAEAGASIPLESVEITIAASEKAAKGYSYIVRNLRTVETINKRKELAEKMLNSLKQLPAPEKNSKKA